MGLSSDSEQEDQAIIDFPLNIDLHKKHPNVKPEAGSSNRGEDDGQQTSEATVHIQLMSLAELGSKFDGFSESKNSSDPWLAQA